MTFHSIPCLKFAQSPVWCFALWVGLLAFGAHAQPKLVKGAQAETATPSVNAINALLGKGCAALREGGGNPHSAIVAKPLPHDSRLVVFPYDKNALYPIQTSFNRFTHIELEQGERVLSSVVNDELEWEQKPLQTGSDIMVRSRVRGATGSMTVITDRRRYQIDLVDVSGCPSESRYQRVSWQHTVGIYEVQEPSSAMLPSALPNNSPANAKRGRMEADSADKALDKEDADLTFRVDSLNTQYSFEGDDDLKPETVFDDGKHTVIKFSKNQQLRPVMFAVAPDGTSEFAEYAPRTTASGSYFIMARLFPHGILLKSGKREVRIRNKSSSCGWFDRACRSMNTTNIN